MKKKWLLLGTVASIVIFLCAYALINKYYPLKENQALATYQQQTAPDKPAVTEQAKEKAEEKKENQPKQDSSSAQPNKNHIRDNVEHYNQYDNTKHGWGFTRNSEHRPPDVGWYGPVISKYNSMYLGNPKDKKIYLTFDEGYENGYTPKILDLLKANDVKAHFFITASYLKSNPELVKRMVAEGHVVGNHSVNHPSLPEVSSERVIQEINGLQEQLNNVVRYDMYLFRPPRGEWSERTLKLTQDLGYKTVFWSMAYQDWLVDQQQGWQRAYDHVTSNIHNGAVILLHAVSSDNTEALERIIKDLQKEGYIFSTIDK